MNAMAELGECVGLDAELRALERRHAAGSAAAAIAAARRLAQARPLPEVLGLLALLLLTEARRAAAFDDAGRALPLAAQDRRRWDAALIAEGLAWVDRALDAREVGAWTLRAAIAALHAQAATARATDWRRIAGLHELLAELDASPAVARERAFAEAMCAAPREGSESA